MSLITLTFGDNYKNRNARFREVSNPFENLKPDSVNQFEVKKVNQFFGERNVYVIGMIKNGVIAEKMKSNIDGKNILVVELESKYGCNKAKQGMNVGLTLAGIEKEDLQPGQVIDFTL